jgi:hypothetical protein
LSLEWVRGRAAKQIRMSRNGHSLLPGAIAILLILGFTVAHPALGLAAIGIAAAFISPGMLALVGIPLGAVLVMHYLQWGGAVIAAAVLLPIAAWFLTWLVAGFGLGEGFKASGPKNSQKSSAQPHFSYNASYNARASLG